jgi:hypothetical protein
MSKENYCKPQLFIDTKKLGDKMSTDGIYQEISKYSITPRKGDLIIDNEEN